MVDILYPLMQQISFNIYPIGQLIYAASQYFYILKRSPCSHDGLSCILPGNYRVITAFYRILPDFAFRAGNRHSRSSEHENYRPGSGAVTLPRAGWRRRLTCRVQVS